MAQGVVEPALPLDHGGPVDHPFEPFPDSALEGSVVDRFEDVARRFPARLAIQDTTVALTYSELAVLVRRIAAATAAATEGRPGPVAILLSANAQFPAAGLGVLSAGRTYVPLDVESPMERNALIATSAGASAVISSSDLIPRARTWFPDDIPVIDLHALPDVARPEAMARSGPDDLACILFTSGSTGVPKGVALDHRGLLQGTQQLTNATHLSSDDRVLMLTSPSVGLGNRCTYYTLLNGAALYVPRSADWGPAVLAQYIRDWGITFHISVPSMMRHIASAIEPGDRLDSIRLVYLGGDRITWSDFDICARSFAPDAALYSVVGSTECGVFLQGYIDPGLRHATTQPPAGRESAGRNVTIVNDEGNVVVDGEVGEIVVSSRFSALGYWQGRDLQVLRFPGDPSDPSMRVYRTGDLGRRRPDGLVEFAGRKDQYIKIHGQRIEPTEVEAALTALREVEDAAIVVRNDESGTPIALVAYVVLRPGVRKLLPRHLQSMLAQRLPRHMIPASIVLLDKLPRLASMKVDRSALVLLDARHSIKPIDRSNDLQLDEIARIFEDVVGYEGATPDDNLVSIGGDSIQAVTLAAEIEHRFNVSISDDLIAQHPTIRELSEWIRSQTA